MCVYWKDMEVDAALMAMPVPSVFCQAGIARWKNGMCYPVSPFVAFKASNPNGQARVDKAISDEDDASDFDKVTGKDVVDGDPIVGKHPEIEGPSKPVPRKCQKEMTSEEFAQHCVTHIPYNESCPYCVAGKKPNWHHRKSSSHRKVPFLCADYGFSTEAATQDVIPILVVYVRPWRNYFATVVETKGHDLNAVKRLARWIRECGLTHFVYRSDREPAIRKHIFEAVKLAGVQAEELKMEDLEDSEPDAEAAAVPEESHVGESQRNGRAER